MTTRLAAELSCEQLVELVTAYLEGALPLAERTRFEQHLLYCAGCSAYVGQLRAQLHASGALREESLEPEARDRLLDAFRGWKGALR
jgi:anti-sigma factor RsiW